MDEKRILHLMEKLDLSRDEAISLINDDKAVDKMTSMRDINGDLTDEQKDASKKARRGTNAKPKSSKREKKIDPLKGEIMHKIITSLGVDVDVINAEREIEFVVDERKFKIVLSCPRK